MRAGPSLLVALVPLGVSVACATSRAEQKGPPEPIHIELPETVITAGPPAQVKLAGLDEGQLFEGGSKAFAASDYESAAAHFERLADVYPGSANALAALYDAGLARERLQQWRAALSRINAYLVKANAPGAKDSIDAQFHAALCEHALGEREAAALRLHALAERPGLAPSRRGEARVQEAVCRIESGARSEGERLLRAALTDYESDKDSAVDPALPAQAEFWLGEVYRSYFQEAKLDAAQMNEKQLGEALEAKAQLLLSAQGHYLRAIRRGDGEWATASGYRIGELYEAFHDQLILAPVPQGFNAELQEAYREELKKKVRVLVEKAIRIYEQTLAAAERVGARNDYVQRTGEALERLRKLLLAPATRG